eukprot:TRINITY_DN2948_c0_g3_i3.p1 TRINITY_DN2948_c0_g3~~TRINITY_DN2948_c0_g3_i3.p1  ORF type:complete len:371 (-),score=86.07 TRINITY_DN2948_c0_g3_i3:87-1199(-)
MLALPFAAWLPGICKPQDNRQGPTRGDAAKSSKKARRVEQAPPARSGVPYWLKRALGTRLAGVDERVEEGEEVVAVDCAVAGDVGALGAIAEVVQEGEEVIAVAVAVAVPVTTASRVVAVAAIAAVITAEDEVDADGQAGRGVDGVKALTETEGVAGVRLEAIVGGAAAGGVITELTEPVALTEGAEVHAATPAEDVVAGLEAVAIEGGDAVHAIVEAGAGGADGHGSGQRAVVTEVTLVTGGVNLADEVGHAEGVAVTETGRTELGEGGVGAGGDALAAERVVEVKDALEVLACVAVREGAVVLKAGDDGVADGAATTGLAGVHLRNNAAGGAHATAHLCARGANAKSRTSNKRDLLLHLFRSYFKPSL